MKKAYKPNFSPMPKHNTHSVKKNLKVVSDDHGGGYATSIVNQKK